MVTVEELQNRFKVANVPGRGRCIIIPLDKFDPDWDQMILDAGLSSHAAEDVVYVILGPEKRPEKPKEEVHPVPSRTWKAEEDELLIELWNQEPKLKLLEIAKRFDKKFPGRTQGSVKNRLARLRKAGKIEGRWVHKEKSPASPSSPHGETFQLLSGVVRTLEEHTELLNKLSDKVSCHSLMQVLEIKQDEGELTIPPKLWEHYVKALLEEDKKFYDIFRTKVKQLLEASK